MTARSIHVDAAPAEDFAPSPDRVVRGAPRGETRNAYESADGRKYFGEWSCGEGAWRVSYSEWEYCRIVEGHVRLTGDDGTIAEAGPDGNLFIEPGFEGIWENLTPVRKLYVIDLGPPTESAD